MNDHTGGTQYSLVLDPICDIKKHTIQYKHTIIEIF